LRAAFTDIGIGGCGDAKDLDTARRLRVFYGPMPRDEVLAIEPALEAAQAMPAERESVLTARVNRVPDSVALPRTTVARRLSVVTACHMLPHQQAGRGYETGETCWNRSDPLA
jgi:hypothetical protein